MFDRPFAEAKERVGGFFMLDCKTRDEAVGIAAQCPGLVAALPQPGWRKRANPQQDHGFMYSHGFTDLDGHVWELLWMDPNAAPPQA